MVLPACDRRRNTRLHNRSTTPWLAHWRMVLERNKTPGASGALPQAAMPARPAPPPMPSFKKPRPVRTASLWRNPKARYACRGAICQRCQPVVQTVDPSALTETYIRAFECTKPLEPAVFRAFQAISTPAAPGNTVTKRQPGRTGATVLAAPFQPDFFWGNSFHAAGAAQNGPWQGPRFPRNRVAQGGHLIGMVVGAV